MRNIKKFLISQIKHVVGTQKNRLNDTRSFEHPKNMLEIVGRKIFSVLR